MRRPNVGVALGAAVAIAAAVLLPTTAASAAPGTNTGSAVTAGTAVTASAPSAACEQIFLPAEYPSGTKLVDLSGLADFTPVSQVGKVKFSPTLEKRSVPGSWATWGSPPATESATPNILYTVGATVITVTLPGKGARKGVVGMEVEPNPFEVHSFTMTVFKKSGAEICSGSVDADGNAGAVVLATAKAKKAKTVTISSDVDFAVAQIRYK